LKPIKGNDDVTSFGLSNMRSEDILKTQHRDEPNASQ
jgi:hypothetical protein